MTFSELQVGDRFRSIVGIMTWVKTSENTASASGLGGDERFRPDERVELVANQFGFDQRAEVA